MKVILLKSVPKVGQKDEIKEVNSGYAQNYLIPKQLAIPADSKSVDKLQKRKASLVAEKDIQSSLFEKELEKIRGQKIHLEEKANEKGVLYSVIHEERISEEIKKTFGITIPKDYIKLAEHIKQLGIYTVRVVRDSVDENLELVVSRKED
ncbi:50S ribosomal protein L9 [Candidatus Nomurabacteria bacterium]|nr:50S ribosomal protein L9 [Candidatus Nomurabacteria bacterium]USN94912.1 MAG: 50S ribosomal protein L9 [Candidatus Nomurabacteria bacterium]